MSFQQPPLIRYNLKERGRKHNGIKRSFDIAALVARINSPKTQEKITTRAMLGYHGHWPRIAFGLEPIEGGMKQGKPVSLEPAFVTTYLKAYDNGDIEHQPEILDTEPGLIVRRMFANRVGGFSSAINLDTNEFFGFDYVNDPNYSTNRGYELALDSTGDGGMSLIDVLMAEQQDRIESMNMLINTLDSGITMALDSASSLERENNDLLELLSRVNKDEPKGVVFDGIVATRAEDAANRLKRESEIFKTSMLPSIQAPDKASEKPSEEYLNLSHRILNY